MVPDSVQLFESAEKQNAGAVSSQRTRPAPTQRRERRPLTCFSPSSKTARSHALFLIGRRNKAGIRRRQKRRTVPAAVPTLRNSPESAWSRCVPLSGGDRIPARSKPGHADNLLITFPGASSTIPARGPAAFMVSGRWRRKNALEGGGKLGRAVHQARVLDKPEPPQKKIPGDDFSLIPGRAWVGGQKETDAAPQYGPTVIRQVSRLAFYAKPRRAGSLR